MTEAGWWIGYVALIIISILLVVIFRIYDKKKRRQIQDKIDMTLISTLQEIACDYRVKVIRSGYGVIRYRTDRMHNANELFETCHDVEVDENTTMDTILDKTDFEIFDKEDSDKVEYFIIFKVFGHHYLTYSESPLNAWREVVQKARKESIRVFGRSTYVDYRRR